MPTSIFGKYSGGASYATLCILIACLVGLFLNCAAEIAMRSETPDGCDAAAYLRQAKLFRVHGLIAGIDTAIRGDVVDAVIKAAKETGFPPQAWQEAIAPACHHYVPRTDRIINQYPPGTGLIFAAFPEGTSIRWTAITAMAFIVLISAIFALGSRALTRGVAYIGCAAVTGLAILHEPNALSAWSSAGVMIIAAYSGAAAFASREKRILLFAILGLVCGVAINIRIPNGFVIFGVVVGLCFEFATRTNPSLAVKCGGTFALCVVLGCVPTLAANWINAGGPLYSTYSSTDAALPDIRLELMSANARTYMSHGWTLALMIFFAIATIAVVMFRRTFSSAVAVMLSANLAFTLAYYLTHFPANSYYVLPIAAWGAYTCLFAWTRSAGDRLTSQSAVAGSIAAAVALGIVLTSLKVIPEPIYRGPPAGDIAFPRGAMVWAETSSVYLTYFDYAYAGKIDFAHAEVATKMVEALRAKGMRQFFVADDPAIKALIDRTAGMKKIGVLLGKDVFVLEDGS